MEGRYGSDKLNMAILGAGIACTFLSMLLPLPGLDGGGILACLLRQCLDADRADMAAAIAKKEAALQAELAE